MLTIHTLNSKPKLDKYARRVFCPRLHNSNETIYPAQRLVSKKGLVRDELE